MPMSSHGSFGMLRLVAAMAPTPKGKRRQVAALHIGLVICPSLARIRSRNRVALLTAPVSKVSVLVVLASLARMCGMPTDNLYAGEMSQSDRVKGDLSSQDSAAL